VDDIVSEAFLKAAKAFGRFDENRARFSTWVTSIARNCMTDYWRKHRQHAQIEDVSEATYAAEDDYPVLNEDAKLVKKLLEGLDEADREIVFLKYYEGLKNVDIARKLDMNPSTIATRLQRALVRMRSAIEKDAR